MIKIIKKIFQGILALILLAVVIVVLVLAINVDFSNPKNLDTFVQGKIKKAEIPGLSVAFIRNGKLDEIKNYGYYDVEQNKPVTENTIFQIASVSKTITATAVMQLVEKGLIDLDGDINRYLPFPIRHPEYPDTPLTIRMLLTHTSGIANNWDVYESFYTTSSGGGDSPVSLEQFVEGFLSPGGTWYDPQNNFIPGKPGTVTNYSNPAYALLGYLVEEVTQMPFDDYCKKAIFEPLEMDRTAWLLKDTDLLEKAIPYDLKNNPLPHYSFASYPDGALKVSTKDFSSFILAIMNDGKYKDKTLLNPDTLEEMFRPQADEGKQALMWDYSIPESLLMNDFSGRQLVGHTGSDPGIFTFVLFNRETKNGLIFFSNKELDLNIKTVNTYLLVRRLIREAGLV